MAVQRHLAVLPGFPVRGARELCPSLMGKARLLGGLTLR